MIKTTEQELGEAYKRARKIIMAMEPMTPRIMGAYWRKEFGLHHKSSGYSILQKFWIEFPDDRDYTAFMLRFA